MNYHNFIRARMNVKIAGNPRFFVHSRLFCCYSVHLKKVLKIKIVLIRTHEKPCIQGVFVKSVLKARTF